MHIERLLDSWLWPFPFFSLSPVGHIAPVPCQHYSLHFPCLPQNISSEPMSPKSQFLTPQIKSCYFCNF
jgi:hypothetical protein